MFDPVTITSAVVGKYRECAKCADCTMNHLVSESEGSATLTCAEWKEIIRTVRKMGYRPYFQLDGKLTINHL